MSGPRRGIRSRRTILSRRCCRVRLNGGLSPREKSTRNRRQQRATIRLADRLPSICAPGASPCLIFLLSLPLLNPWVRGDGVGYYAFFRAPLIEHNFDFTEDYRHANESFHEARVDGIFGEANRWGSALLLRSRRAERRVKILHQPYVGLRLKKAGNNLTPVGVQARGSNPIISRQSCYRNNIVRTYDWNPQYFSLLRCLFLIVPRTPVFHLATSQTDFSKWSCQIKHLDGYVRKRKRRFTGD